MCVYERIENAFEQAPVKKAADSVGGEAERTVIEGVRLTALRRIETEGGCVLHALKKSETDFRGFGEAYFSTVSRGIIRGWKRHRRMTLNLVVPVGEVRFVVHDDRPESASFGRFQEVRLSPVGQYRRLTVMPGLWMAFQGLSPGESLLLNLADREHDPAEVDRVSLDTIPFPW
jgi:dTDP-4-dehydrorhamnose 3,5-epimerase